MVVLDLQSALTFTVLLILAEYSLKTLRSCCPIPMTLAGDIGRAVGLMILTGLSSLVGYIAVWLLAAPAFLVLGTLWAVVRLYRLCRKTWPYFSSTLVCVDELTKPGQVVVCNMLVTIGTHLMLGFGSAFVVKPGPACSSLIIKVKESSMIAHDQ